MHTYIFDLTNSQKDISRNELKFCVIPFLSEMALKKRTCEPRHFFNNGSFFWRRWDNCVCAPICEWCGYHCHHYLTALLESDLIALLFHTFNHFILDIILFIFNLDILFSFHCLFYVTSPFKLSLIRSTQRAGT